jgi:hypothetical protein
MRKVLVSHLGTRMSNQPSSEAGVIGVPHEVNGEAVKAVAEAT